MQQSERILSNVEKGGFVLDAEDEDTVHICRAGKEG